MRSTPCSSYGASVFSRCGPPIQAPAPDDIAQVLRRELAERPFYPDQATPLQSRLINMMREMVGDLVVALQANTAIENSRDTRLKAPALVSYRDPLLGAITGLRSTLVFLIGAAVWFATGAPTAVLFMILPVVYSIMLIRLPAPALAMRQLLVGALIAVPVALFFGLGLLAAAPQSFLFLVMILGAPLFVSLIAIADMDLRPYGLGFAITYILLIQPNNHMIFAVDVFLSTAVALIAAISGVYAVFRLIAPPGVRLLRARLIARTVADLRHLGEPGGWDSAERFNARMAERLMRLSAYDRAQPQARRLSHRSRADRAQSRPYVAAHPAGAQKRRQSAGARRRPRLAAGRWPRPTAGVAKAAIPIFSTTAARGCCGRLSAAQPSTLPGGSRSRAPPSAWR